MTYLYNQVISRDSTIATQTSTIAARDSTIAARDATIDQKDTIIAQKNALISSNNLLNQTFWISGGASNYNAPTGPGVILTATGSTCTIDGNSRTPNGVALLPYNSTAVTNGYVQGCSLNSYSNPISIPMYASPTNTTYSMTQNSSSSWTLAGPGLLFAVYWSVSAGQNGGTDTSGGAAVTVSWNNQTMFYNNQSKGGGTGNSFGFSQTFTSLFKWTNNLSFNLSTVNRSNMNVDAYITLTYVLL